jgi:hypothetical protein
MRHAVLLGIGLLLALRPQLFLRVADAENPTKLQRFRRLGCVLLLIAASYAVMVLLRR